MKTELTDEQWAELSSMNGVKHKTGEQIAFFLNGKEVGRTDLIEFSTAAMRMRTAEMIGVEAYDDFHFIRPNGEVRAKASDIKNHSSVSAVDVDDYGIASGMEYQWFLKRREHGHCPNCGHKPI